MSSSIEKVSSTPDWTTAQRIAEQRGGIAVSPTTIQYTVTEKTKAVSRRMPSTSTSDRRITRVLSKQTKADLQKFIDDETSPPTSTTTSKSSSPSAKRNLSPLTKVALTALINRESPEKRVIPFSKCSPSTKEAVRQDLQVYLNAKTPHVILTEEDLDSTLTELQEHLENT